MVFCIALGVDVVLRGSLPAIIYSGGQGYMESTSRVQLESYYNTVGLFHCNASSSTPIRVVTREARYIHALSLTLEHSMPISSPVAPTLTSPRALCSRVLLASSTLQDVFECIEYIE